MFSKTTRSQSPLVEPSLQQKSGSFLVVHERHSFRLVAFEALFFVGEHALLTRGIQALFDLSPDEFHRIFCPLVASMGDAETLERWLASTEVLADKYLSDERVLTEDSLCKGHQKMTVATKTAKMPVNQATAMFE